jgi:hypothetical protein
VGFKVHSPHLIECVLSTNGRQAIPSQVKALTASGKVSVKSMPRVRFVEIYQDYVCGCVLRVARELFALLPVETVLVTASAESLDTSTGQPIFRRDQEVCTYADNVRAILSAIQDLSGTRVIWVTTTPVNEERHRGNPDFWRYLDDETEYNRAASAMAGSLGVEIHGLFIFVMESGRG